VTAPSSAGASRSQRPQQPHDERSSSFRLTKADPRRSRGDDGRGDLVENLEPEGSNAPKVAGQIETPRPPDPIMRRPRADREEKRVTHGRDMRNEDRLDPSNPNQRRFLARRFAVARTSTIVATSRSARVAANDRVPSDSAVCPADLNAGFAPYYRHSDARRGVTSQINPKRPLERRLYSEVGCLKFSRRQRSITISPWGWEQQISTLPSAGGSTGSS